MKQITAIFSRFNIYIHFKERREEKLYQPHLKMKGIEDIQLVCLIKRL